MQPTLKDLLEPVRPTVEGSADWTQRLIRLDEAHYFDPEGQTVLVAGADGAGYDSPGQSSERAGWAAGTVEQKARQEGYKPLQGGLFWHAAARRLYVKEREHYVLFALDRPAFY
jgi:hypothetical protein